MVIGDVDQLREGDRPGRLLVVNRLQLLLKYSSLGVSE